MKYINCKTIAQEILDEVKCANTPKGLLIIAVGNNPASESYIKGKVKDCIYCDIPCLIKRPETKKQLEQTILNANENPSIGGIIVQLPLPNGWDEDYFVNLVATEKDVDGFKSKSAFAPCTPEGIIHILKTQIGDLTGLKALVIGRGKLVGEPLVNMLLKENCTVTIGHSRTKENVLLDALNSNDIVISATGVLGLVDLTECYGRIVIDAGISRNEDGKLRGDCYGFTEEEDPGLMVTPVPGGVGLLTRAMLMKHMMEVNR